MSSLVNSNAELRPWQGDFSRWGPRPSIHMPKWASRHWRKIVEIGAERIQDITEEDCIAEGVTVPVSSEGCPPGKVRPLFKVPTPYKPPEDRDTWHEHHARWHFAILWNETYGLNAWERNDWVFVLKTIEAEKP